jgi:hypothetical protein
MPNEKTIAGRVRKTICLAISAILILGILTSVGFTVINGNAAKPASPATVV